MRSLRDSVRGLHKRFLRRNVFQPGHRVRLLYNGTDYFPVLLEEIDAARYEIYLESYLFETDDIGQRVMAALAAAAQRGVRVRLLLDGFGARYFPQVWKGKLLEVGVQLLFFRPESWHLSLNRARLRRLHRKLAIFDGRVGFVGGINILTDIEPYHVGLAPRYDYAARVEGPIVSRLHRAMVRMWRQTALVQLRRDWLEKTETVAVNAASVGPTAASFVIRDNFHHRHDIEHEYRRAIRQARDEVVIANAYFLPGYRFRQELCAAAERGVKVVLLLQGQVDNFLVHWATRFYYQYFISAGIQIYEYNAGFMHAKVAVIDSQWATIGSSNLDPLSLLLAREANLFVQDHKLASELRDDLWRKIEKYANCIKSEHISRIGFTLRVLVWSCFTMVRFIMNMSGYGGRRYLE